MQLHIHAANVSVIEGLGFFDEALPAGVVTDFFLRAKHERSGVQAASCPLSYFQKTAEPKFMDLSPADKVEHVKTLVPLGKKYLFDKIEAPSGADIWICRSDHSMGLAPAWYKLSFAVVVCCCRLLLSFAGVVCWCRLLVSFAGVV